MKKLEITRRWLSLQSDEGVDVKLLFQVSSVVVALFLAVLFWTITLRKEVAVRRKIEFELRQSQNEADKANKAKSNYLANMSHEIKTPLNAILGFTEIMSSEIYGKINNPKYKEYLKDIQFSGNNLAQVITAILNLSKIDAGKWEVKFETFNVNSTLDECIGEFDQRISDKNIQITQNHNLLNSSKGVNFTSDKRTLEMIIHNLISNAIKYSHNDGMVSCLITVDEIKDTVQFNIKDNGIGIEENKLSQILNPFSQSPEIRKLNDTGSGLGLALVTKLIDVLNGRLDIKSELGIGTEVQVTLPNLKLTS